MPVSRPPSSISFDALHDQVTSPSERHDERERPLLEITDLTVEFADSHHGTNMAVRDVSLDVARHETLGVVGESGSGKSVTMMSALGLTRRLGARVTGGRCVFDGIDLLTLSERELRRVRGSAIGVVFQDPMTSLNPSLTIGRQLAEPLVEHRDLSRADARRRALELLDLVRIPDAAARLAGYPHELSGGMRQRVMIAMALACDPALLIADEPTTALDVTVQAQIVELLGELRRERGMAVVLVSHDLGVIAGLADRVAVMYGGTVVEAGSAADVLGRPRHPYTLGLLRSYPRLDEPRADRLPVIPGAPPDPFARPDGCPFAPRCPFAHERCTTAPPMRTQEGSAGAPQHFACWADLGPRADFERGERGA